jgi:hypothetical protein
VIVATLAVAAIAYRRASDAVARGASPWLRVPFSLLLAWLSVATIANVAAALTASGFDGGALGPAPWAIAMIAAAAVLAIALALGFRDPVVPAVVAWAAFAIRAADGQDHAVAAAALAAAIACAAAVVATAVRGAGRSVAHHCA